MAHISNDDLIRHLKIDEHEYAGDTGVFLSGAQSFVERYLGFSLDRDVATSKFVGFDKPIRLFGVSISEVVVTYLDAQGATQTLSESDLYISDQGSFSTLHLLCPSPEILAHPEPVSVDYVSGYGDENGLPGAIRSAVLLVAGDLFANREDSSPLKLNSIPLGAERLLMPFQVVKL